MFLDNDKSKTATSIAGFTVFLTAVCHGDTGLQLRSGFGFCQGVERRPGREEPGSGFQAESVGHRFI